MWVAALCVGASGAQDTTRDPIRVFVFAPNAPDEARPVAVRLPVRDYIGERSPTHLRTYYIDARRALRAADALADQLQLTRRRQHLLVVVDRREKADVFLEVVATEYGSKGQRRVNPPVVVARLTVRHADHSADFLGESVDTLRPPTHHAAQQVERWIGNNYLTLQQLIYGLARRP